MSLFWKIILSAIGISIAAFIIWVIAILRDGRRLRGQAWPTRKQFEKWANKTAKKGKGK